MTFIHPRLVAPAVLTAAAALSFPGIPWQSAHNGEGEALASYLGHSPVADYFSQSPATFPPPSDEDDEEQRLERRAVEEAVAVCMRDAGFEYVVDVTEHAEIVESWNDTWGLPTEEFATSFGYGLSTIHFSLDADNPVDVDPNLLVRDSLPEPERTAYVTTLFGTADDGVSPAKPGCHDEVREELGITERPDGPTLDDIDAEFGHLFDEVSAIVERAQHDPRATAAVDAWARCMDGRGHPGLDALDDAIVGIETRLFDAAHPRLDGRLSEGAGLSIQGDTLYTVDAETMDEVRQDEIDLATADLACRDEQRSTFTEVRREYEQEFVDAHWVELERYRDAVTGTHGS